MWNPIARVAALGLSLRPLPPLSIAVGARLTWVRMGQDIRRYVAVEDPAARRVLNDPLSWQLNCCSCLLANSPPRVQRYHVLDVVLLICALRVDFLANVSDLHRFAHSVDALGGRANVTIMRLIVRLGRDERPWPLITPDGCSNEGGTRHQNRLQHGELQT